MFIDCINDDIYYMPLRFCCKMKFKLVQALIVRTNNYIIDTSKYLDNDEYQTILQSSSTAVCS